MASPEAIESAQEIIRQCRLRLVTVGIELIDRQMAGELEDVQYDQHPYFKEAQEAYEEASRAFSYISEL